MLLTSDEPEISISLDGAGVVLLKHLGESEVQPSLDTGCSGR